ncbi:MAG: bile acid:sodium symporter family protein, partial [Chloroflexota bacterium]|nr:bile acid:sodium symporter family protein [Chloroflexota bacterium]
IRESLRNPRLLALALVANFIAVPLIALVITRLLPLTTEGRTAVILLGATAGAPLLPKLATLSGGRVPFSIGLMVLLMLATVAYAPLVLPLLLPDVTVLPAEIARSLLVVMLLPLTVGLIARSRYAAIADWSADLSRIAGASMAIGLAAGLLVGWEALLASIGSWIIVAAILLALAATAIGGLFAAGLDTATQRVAGLGAAMRNVSAALLIAGRDFGPQTLVMTMAATIVLMVTLVILAGELGRRGGATR